LGDAYKNLEKWSEAANIYSKACELLPDFPWCHNNFADVLVKLERYEEAIAPYQRASELNPDFPWVHVNLAEVLWQTGRQQEAIAPYEKALALGLDIPDAYEKVAQALWEKAQTELQSAVRWYKEAIALNPDNTALYHKALEIVNDDPDLYLGLGKALIKQGKIHGAIAFYQMGLQAVPDHPELQAALQEVAPGKKSL